MAENVLKSWAGLNAALASMEEKDCWKLLEKERTGKKRWSFLLRIYSRANRLRTERERKELMR